jgi:hypothetical protein
VIEAPIVPPDAEATSVGVPVVPSASVAFPPRMICSSWIMTDRSRLSAATPSRR